MIDSAGQLNKFSTGTYKAVYTVRGRTMIISPWYPALATSLLVSGVLSTTAITANAESNRNEVRAELSQGWDEIVYGVELNEGEYARFGASTAAAVACECAQPIINYFEDYVNRTIAKVQRDLPEISARTVDRMVAQALDNPGRVFSVDGLEASGGLATYNNWETAIYHEPRTEECRQDLPFGGWTSIPCSTLVEVEREIPLPNKFQPYIRFRLTYNDSGNRNSVSNAESPAGRHVDWTKNLGDRISSHQELPEGSYLQSGDGRWRMVVQGDGNLVIYGPGNSPIWASNSAGQGTAPFKLTVQSDGNLVMHGGTGPTWATGTDGSGVGPYNLVMQNDANLVLYDSEGPIWASGTCCR